MSHKPQHNGHSNNHRIGTRGSRLMSKIDLSENFALILEEETERYLPVIEENESSNDTTKGLS